MILTIDEDYLSGLPVWAVVAVEHTDALIQYFAEIRGLDIKDCVSRLRQCPLESYSNDESSNMPRDERCLMAAVSGMNHLATILGGVAEIEDHATAPCTEDDIRKVYRIFFAALSLVKAYLDIADPTIDEVASKGGRSRHVETYAMKAEIISHWKDQVDPKLSNEKAAKILGKQFPLSHRTLVEYVAQAKREMHSASTA